MGTKNNPGSYDCYKNAEPDEPMFILLGRDKHGPSLVRLWATMRELDGEEPVAVREAMECCQAMMIWGAQHGKKVVGLSQAVLAGVLDLTRCANLAVKNGHNVPTGKDSVLAVLGRCGEMPELVDPAIVPDREDRIRKVIASWQLRADMLNGKEDEVARHKLRALIDELKAVMGE